MRMMIGAEGTGAEDWRGWIDFLCVFVVDGLLVVWVSN